MNKKILIFCREIRERAGGYPTYLFNLKKYVIDNKLTDQIHFYSDYIKATEIKEKCSFRSFISLIDEKIFHNNIKILRYALKAKNGNENFENISINNYDYIHFHYAFDLCLHRKALESFKGKIILTNHDPGAPHLNFLIQYNTELRNVWKISIKIYERLEDMAFNKLPDYIIFPCEEAVEPYYNSYPKFKEIINRNKLRYVPTGIIPAKYKYSRTVTREKYNIAENEVLITYIGRHNYIKGYDILLEFGKQLLNKYNNITFLIAGKEYPMKGLPHEKWIEAGWVDDPYSIINASDIFILPNRETYFDLILLEVMSLGKPVLLPYSGGNKYFERFSSKGLIFFNKDSMRDMIDVFEKNYKDYKYWNEYGSINKEIFNNNFNNDIFGNNYLTTINNLN
jgi:glycosyltransferase involved in cell wall biosynthesis